MALLEILTRKDLPAYSLTTTLDGTVFQLSFTYNDRMAKWFLGVADPQGVEIIAPVPVVASIPLFDRFKGADVPSGVIFAFDTSGQNTDPGRYDLGDRVRLFYQEVT